MTKILFASETLSGPEYAVVLSDVNDFFGDRYQLQENLTSIIVNRADRCLVIPTTKKWCYIRQEYHVENNPYILISDAGARFECAGKDCLLSGGVKAIPIQCIPKSLQDLYMTMFQGTVDHSLMADAKWDCCRIIRADFPDENPTPSEVVHVTNTLVTKAQHRACNNCQSRRMSFVHFDRGYRILCLDCFLPWPLLSLIPVLWENYPALTEALAELTIST
jgi:hypothetical protein